MKLSFAAIVATCISCVCAIRANAQTQQTELDTALNALASAKTIEEKIIADAPFVMNALKECPEPISPAQITSMHQNETDFCPGMPIKKCPCSPKGACSPLQLMPATIVTFAKSGEDPETLVDSMKIAVRHLCYARGKDNAKLDPASDAAILRYNASSEYLRSIRAKQMLHLPTWQAISSGNITIASNLSLGTMNPHLVEGPPQVIAFESNPLDGFLDWFSAWGNERHRDSGSIVPHLGVDLGKHEAVPIKSVCSGVVTFASVLGDGLGGNTVMIVCENDRTSHMHLASISVQVGDDVKAGQQIGINGQTGNAARGKSGPHDHFKLERKIGKDWVAVNPCAGYPGQRVLNCGALFGPNTYFAPLNPPDSLAANP